MKNTIEVTVTNSEIEPYMIPVPLYNLVNMKVTLLYQSGLSYYAKKENIKPNYIQYYLGFLTGICYGQVIKDMLISENEINGKLIIETEDVIL